VSIVASDRRKGFNAILKAVLGSENVYFQPPEDRRIEYPCIVYERDDVLTKHADNLAYKVDAAYQVTYIDHDPDGVDNVRDDLLMLPHSKFDRHFATSGLNHDVFVIHH
jgi:hypothetical protein